MLGKAPDAGPLLEDVDAGPGPISTRAEALDSVIEAGSIPWALRAEAGPRALLHDFTMKARAPAPSLPAHRPVRLLEPLGGPWQTPLVDSKTESMRVGPDTFVTLTYVLFDQDGNIAGEADKDDPLTYVHGYAQILPGLERGVAGLAKGDRREIVIDPDEAFGDPDEKAILELDRADLPELGRALQVGDELIAEDDEDDQLLMRVVELRKDSVVVDTNHPLAGQTVRFEVEVRDIRSATEDEIASAEADLESRTDVLCCAEGDHDHDHAHPHSHDHGDHHHHHRGDLGVPVMQLRRKLPN